MSFVAETLVVPFCVIVHYVFGYRCAQVSLTERCLRCLLLVMCTHPFAKEALTLHLARC